MGGDNKHEWMQFLSDTNQMKYKRIKTKKQSKLENIFIYLLFVFLTKDDSILADLNSSILVIARIINVVAH